jgi:hypothetical protein
MVVPTKDVPELAIKIEGAGVACATNPEEKANMAAVIMEARVARYLDIIGPSIELKN